MTKRAAGILFFAMLGTLPLTRLAAAAENRPIVAVFPIEDKSGKLRAQALDQLTDYLCSLMSRKGFQVVPRSELKARLTEAKKDSHKPCFDQGCQIEIGKEAAAQKSLASQILRFGTKCKVTVNLYDLKKAASTGAGAASGGCDEDGVVTSLEAAVEDLFGGAAVGEALPAPAPGPATGAGDDKPAYQKELAQAWQALAAAVRQAGPQDQLDRYQEFLARYPVDNPYQDTVQKAIKGLEARLDRAAEAKRNADEKAAALAAERQRAARLKEAYDGLKALTGPATGQREAWQQFLSDYPDRNPYLSTTRRKLVELEARVKREAAQAVAEAMRAPTGALVWVASGPAGVELTLSEVTVTQYLACLEDGKCTEPRSRKANENCNWGYADRAAHPVNCVDWNQATAFCEWAGGRLPAEEELEAEATNEGTREYTPWGGAKVDCDHAVWGSGPKGHGCGRKSTWPVCSKPRGNSVSGLCDMLGNVWEWTSSWWDEKKEDHVVRGASYDGFDGADYCASPRSHGLSDYEYLLGFRCARDGK